MSVQRRGRGFYSRLKVPQALRAQVGKFEIVRSLKTTKQREARQRATLWEARVSDLLFRIQAGVVAMTPEEIEIALCAFERDSLAQFEEGMVILPPSGSDQHDAIEGVLTDGLDRNREELMRGDYRRASALLQSSLPDLAIELDKKTDDRLKACREILIVEQRVLKEQLKRLNGDYSSTGSRSVAANDNPRTGLLLADAIEQFTTMKVAGNHWAPKSQMEAQKAFKRLLDHMQNRPVEVVAAG